jgi:hypothetical protein
LRHLFPQAAQPAPAPLAPHAALQPALLAQAPALHARPGAGAAAAPRAPPGDAKRPAAPRRPRAPPAAHDTVLCRVPGCAAVIERTYHKRIRCARPLRALRCALQKHCLIHADTDV